MGHYDDFHEEEQQLAAARMRRRLLVNYARMDKAMEEIKSAVSQAGGSSLKASMRHLEKEWVLWCHDAELLVEDPQIVIDLLKDKK